MNTKEISISFCTVCMNRLHHLKATLPQNISDNSDYGTLEFIVLDYNSTDGLEKWIKDEMQAHLHSGRLRYFRTSEPKLFHRSHSRNVSFKLASGDVLCNIDADNFTGKGFAAYVNDCFGKDNKIFLTAIDFQKTLRNHYPISDVLGRVCFRKAAFMKIRGYNENMSTHGFQDYDFANRLEMSGNRRVIITNLGFLTAIKHDDKERYSNEYLDSNFYMILCRQISPCESLLVFLLKNGLFEKGTIVNNSLVGHDLLKYAYTSRRFKHAFTVREGRWIMGKWTEDDHCAIEMQFKNGKNERLLLKGKNTSFFKIVDPALISQLIVFNTQYTNRNTMQRNWDKKIIVTNKGRYGTALVSDSSNSVQLIKT